MGRNVGVGTSVRGYKKEKKSPVGMIATSVVLLMIALVCVGLFTPLFSIDTITVVGNQRLEAEFLAETSGLMIGANVFRANLSAAEQNISALSYVDKVKVSRKLPKGIEISVEESKPKLLIPFVTGYVVVDVEGKALEAIKDKGEFSLPVVAGASLSLCEIGKPMEFSDEDKLNLLQSMMKEFENVGITEQITTIDLTDIYEIQIVIGNQLYVNYGGDTDFSYKTQMLVNVLGNIPSPPKGYVDLRAGGNVFYKENYSAESIPIITT